MVGDSIIKGIKKQELRRHVKANFYVKSFPGATTEDMNSYIIPTLNRKPDCLLIHCGTNDLRNDDPETMANKIKDLAVKAKKEIPVVFVSGILPRGDSDLLEGKRLQVNSLLCNLLAAKDIHFIRHDNFEQEWRFLLSRDGLHLNDSGTNALGQDFVDFLKNF